MDSIINSKEIIEKTEVVADFPDKVTVVPCTVNVCLNGHEWTPEIGLTSCPGCSSPMIVLRTVQCPICNEPIAKVRLRSDHLPKGGVITPICKGSESMAEVVKIEMERRHYLKEQENHKVREMPTKV